MRSPSDQNRSHGLRATFSKSTYVGHREKLEPIVAHLHA